jgi:thiol-disulfide isomerase/thioredoxin
VLESKDAKLIGRYSWAEIGFCYFLVNVIALMSTEHAYNVLALFAAISVPYSIWSIWYQHRLAQWCPLCVMVQIVLASQFVSCIFVGDYSLPIQLDTHTIIFLSIAYISSILALNMVLPILSHSLELKEVRWRYNHIKMDKQVFSLLLNTGDNYDVDCYSSIKFGNVDSDTVVTIFSNPYCNPCAIMHKRLQALYASNTCIIQYIFTSFKPEWDVINKCLIAIYQQYSVEEAWHIYTEWDDHGKLSQEYFFDKYNIDIHTDDIEREFQQHEQWKKITNLNSTPTILVNGHKIPYGYTVEDIQYVS